MLLVRTEHDLTKAPLADYAAHIVVVEDGEVIEVFSLQRDVIDIAIFHELNVVL